MMSEVSTCTTNHSISAVSRFAGAREASVSVCASG